MKLHGFAFFILSALCSLSFVVSASESNNGIRTPKAPEDLDAKVSTLNQVIWSSDFTEFYSSTGSSLSSHTLPFQLDGPVLKSEEGTISLWFRPSWKKSGSHTLLSMRWQSVQPSYMALSYGWWEPLGQNRLYFILDNQSVVHCSSPIEFEDGEWFHLAVTWQTGASTECKIYVDGDLTAQSADDTRRVGSHDGGSILIGSDKFALDQRARSFQGDIAGLSLYAKAWSEKKIREHFGADMERYSAIKNSKNSWLRNAGCTLHSDASDCATIHPRNLYIFDEDISWAYSKHSIDQRLDRIQRAGFNHYVVNVWHGNGAYFPTRAAHVDERLAKRITDGFDPLKYLTEEAHKRSISVHAWVTVVRREGERYVQYFDEGTPAEAYNPHLPAFRDFIVGLMSEIATNYDVDGINLDYIRTQGLCTSDFCAENYKQETGYTLEFDLLKRFVVGNARNRLQSWQDNAIDDIVCRVSKAARPVRPDIVISADDHPPEPGQSRPLQGRNSLKWLQQGCIDLVFNMDYKKKLSYESAKKIIQSAAKPDRILMLIANYDLVDGHAVPRSGAQMIEYMNFLSVHLNGSEGLGFYLYNQLTDEQVEAMHRHFVLPTKSHQVVQQGAGN